MTRRIAVLLAVPLLLVLAGCAPARHIGLPSHPGVTTVAPPIASHLPTATPKPTETAPVAPQTINPADYLINGTPNVPDADGEWFGEWAFFTDATKTVWCRFDIFSGDAPGGGCYIVPSAISKVTYAIPAGASNHCDLSSDNARDGYVLGLNGQTLGDQLAGWSGCATEYFEPAADLAKTKVLPDGAVLTVAPFSCSTQSSAGTCTWIDTYDNEVAKVTLGLHVATFSHT